MLGRLFAVAAQIARDEGVAKSGFRMTTNSGAGAGQSVPHLHFHLMDNASWRRAHGLPAQLQYFTRNGQLVERGEPRRGDSIAATTVEADARAR